MPPPRDRDRDNTSSRSRSHRSISPPGQGRKRSWLPASRERSQYNRSPSPKRKEFKSPSQFHQPPSRRSRSRSPKQQKRNIEGVSKFQNKDSFKQRSPVRQGFRQRSPIRQERGAGDAQRNFGTRKRSLSPRNRSISPRKRSLSPLNQKHGFGSQRDRKHKNASPPPSDFNRYHNNQPLVPKKKSRHSPSPVPTKRTNQRRSPSPIPPPSKKPVQPPSRTSGKEEPSSQRRVSDTNKRKKEKILLHNRFSTDDLGPFHLNTKDNVTIAILRNPKAIPSDDVTVQHIFDSSLFKMVHKKTEGKKPIFDREEIKIWRHDERMEDEDQDFEERRLIRVKSSSKKAADSLTRMSPDVLRKSFGLRGPGNNNSRSGSPHRSPNIKLNPQPDSRYESRYQKQLEKERDDGPRRHPGGDERRGRVMEASSSRERRKSTDLRDALERRRSGKEEDFERPERSFSDNRKFRDHDDRNVVMDQDRSRFRDERDRGGRGGRAFGRGRSRGMGQQWSPRRNIPDSQTNFGSRDRGFDRRDRFSRSPDNFRGRGRGGFRGRGRGGGDRDRDNIVMYDNDRQSPPGDSYVKFANHDDRYMSPGRERTRGARFQSNRGFRGNRGFRIGGNNRGRGFRTRPGRGFYPNNRDSRSIERVERRSADRWSDREWKHDLYDSVQSDDEVPHSTTVNN